MRYVIVKEKIAGFLVGLRFVTRSDGPFAVDDDQRAAELISAGLVEGCLPPQATPPEEVMRALDPAPSRAEKALAKPARRKV